MCESTAWYKYIMLKKVNIKSCQKTSSFKELGHVTQGRALLSGHGLASRLVTLGYNLAYITSY